MSSNSWSDDVILFDEAHQPSPALSETLQAHVRDRLASHESPRDVEFVDALPRTSTGTLRRRALREREGVIEAD